MCSVSVTSISSCFFLVVFSLCHQLCDVTMIWAYHRTKNQTSFWNATIFPSRSLQYRPMELLRLFLSTHKWQNVASTNTHSLLFTIAQQPLWQKNNTTTSRRNETILFSAFDLNGRHFLFFFFYQNFGFRHQKLVFSIVPLKSAQSAR